jgi:hypothetical protein
MPEKKKPDQPKVPNTHASPSPFPFPKSISARYGKVQRQWLFCS